MTANEELRRISRRQAGLFTRSQASQCGFSPYQIRRRISQGAWQVVISPVLGVAELRITLAVRDRAAQLAVPGSVLGGPSAARWWGMAVPDLGTHLFVGAHYGRPLTGVRLLRDPLRPFDVQVMDGVSLTSRARSVFDCLRLLPPEAALVLLDRALQQGWITRNELTGRVGVHAGRLGAPRLVGLVRKASLGGYSAAERLAVGILRRAGLTGWVTNHAIQDEAGLVGVGDVVFVRARLVLEIDGWAYHVTPESFQRDRTRQNRLVAAGWTVLRFTWRDLTERPDQVIDTIRSVLSTLGA
ncbi:MAG: DUF559 domain-containing protein [Micromonosporaceae bacterium]